MTPTCWYGELVSDTPPPGKSTLEGEGSLPCHYILCFSIQQPLPIDGVEQVLQFLISGVAPGSITKELQQESVSASLLTGLDDMQLSQGDP